MIGRAATIGRSKYGADSEDGQRLAANHRPKVVAFGAGEQRVAVQEGQSMEAITAPFGGHLCTIPRAVGLAAKSLSPNGIGAVEDLLEAGRIGW